MFVCVPQPNARIDTVSNNQFEANKDSGGEQRHIFPTPCRIILMSSASARDEKHHATVDERNGLTVASASPQSCKEMTIFPFCGIASTSCPITVWCVSRWSAIFILPFFAVVVVERRLYFYYVTNKKLDCEPRSITFIQIHPFAANRRTVDIHQYTSPSSSPSSKINIPVIMHSAARFGQTVALRELLKDSSTNVNEKDQSDCTPLYLSSENGHLDTVRMLIGEFGANVNVPDNWSGSTPLHIAVENGNTEMVRALVTEFGADVNATDYDRCTPLFIACEGGHKDAVRVLVIEGAADMSVVNKYGHMALDVAAQKGHTDIVRIFVVEFGTDVNVKNNNGRTPLHKASLYRHEETVRMLLELGAEANIKCKVGHTPLHEACIAGRVEAVRVLVEEFGADVNVVDSEGRTPLQLALLCEKVDVVRALREYGAV